MLPFPAQIIHSSKTKQNNFPSDFYQALFTNRNVNSRFCLFIMRILFQSDILSIMKISKLHSNEIQKKSVSPSCLILFYFLYVGPHCVARAVLKCDSPVSTSSLLGLHANASTSILILGLFQKGLVCLQVDMR